MNRALASELYQPVSCMPVVLSPNSNTNIDIMNINSSNFEKLIMNKIPMVIFPRGNSTNFGDENNTNNTDRAGR
jgi:hypothetical protein